MNQGHQTNAETYQEIGLVDLAAILWIRRYIALSVFLITVAAGLVYVGVAKDKYEYVSLYQVAGLADGELVEDPEISVMALKSRWLPDLLEKQGPDGSSVPVAFDVQKKAGIIRLITEAGADQSESVADFHGKLLSRLESHQRALLEEEESQLRKRISSNEELMASVQSSGDSVGLALQAVLEKQMELRAKLDSLQAGSSLVIARQSLKPTAPDRVFVAVVAVFLGSILGVLSAFLVEFGLRVQKRYRELAARS